MPADSRKPPPPPPSPEEAIAEEAVAIASASSVMMTAASAMIAEMFAVATKRMEEATRDKLPPDGPVQKSTAAMILQLQAQLNRALGVTPEDGLPKHGKAKAAAAKDGEPKS